MLKKVWNFIKCLFKRKKTARLTIKTPKIPGYICPECGDVGQNILTIILKGKGLLKYNGNYCLVCLIRDTVYVHSPKVKEK